MRRRSSPFRVVAWMCLLAVLLAPALPPTAGAPAILAEAAPLFGVLPASTLRCVTADAPPPDSAPAADLPARAPPLT
jgi:hypothetical protein